MSESGDAAEQVVRMMLSGSETAIRLSGAALKNIAALLLALAKDHKQVCGKVSLRKMLKETRDIRVFPMSPEQFKRFKAKARKMKILYSAIRDKGDRGAVVDVLIPSFEVERANQVFEKIRYAPAQAQPAAHERHEDPQEEQAPKKEPRSEPASHDTRDSSSSCSAGKETKNNERPSVDERRSVRERRAPNERRPVHERRSVHERRTLDGRRPAHERRSVEQRLREHKAALAQGRRQVPARQRTRGKGRAK